MQGNSQKTRLRSKVCAAGACTNWINRVFSTNILQKARLWCWLNQQLSAYLPKPINQHCWLMDWTFDEITLGVDAAEWLIHVREREQEIKAYIISHIGIHSTIKIRYLIRPDIAKTIAKPPPRSKVPSKISPRNRNIIRTIANTISNESLKNSLLKLTDK